LRDSDTGREGSSLLSRLPVPARVIIALAVVGGVTALAVKALGGARSGNDGQIRASGIIEARTVELACEVAGTVVERPIDKGDRVRAGRVVAVIASEVTAAQVEQGRAALATARENLRRAEEAVKLQDGVAQRDVDRASAALLTASARSRDVQDGARPQEIRAAQATARQAKAAAQAAQAKLDQLQAGLRPEEIRQTEAAYEAAAAQVAAARAQLADLQAGARVQETAQARAQIDKASTALHKTRKDYERALSLVSQGAMAQQQLDATTAAYEAAQADLKTARERLGLLQAGARTDQVQTAKAQLDSALANQKSAREALALARQGPRREDIDQAKAAVRQAQASYDAAVASLDLVRAGARTGQRDTARRQVGEAQAALNLARENRRQVELRRADADAAQAQVSQAEAALEALQASLDKYRVAAPAAGIIDDTHVRIGEVVRPGSSLATLVDFSDTWVTVYVPEPRLARVVVGHRAEVTVDGLPGQSFTGKVRRIASEAEFTPKYVQTQDERARTVFAVEIALPNPQGLLKPGMPADAVIAPGPAKG